MIAELDAAELHAQRDQHRRATRRTRSRPAQRGNRRRQGRVGGAGGATRPRPRGCQTRRGIVRAKDHLRHRARPGGDPRQHAWRRTWPPPRAVTTCCSPARARSKSPRPARNWRNSTRNSREMKITAPDELRAGSAEREGGRRARAEPAGRHAAADQSHSGCACSCPSRGWATSSSAMR